MAGKWRRAKSSCSWLSGWIGAAFLISIAHAGQPTLALRDRPDISVAMDIQPDSCSAAVPITIQSSREGDFRDGSKILAKVMAWAQVTVSTTCPDTNAIQLTGIVSGQTIYQGKAERTNDWALSETRLEQSSSPSHLHHSNTSRPVSSPDNTITHPAERSGEIKRDKTSNSQNTPINSPAVDVSGRWTGTTFCPSGLLSFTIDVKGSKGTFSYGSGKDQRSHLIRVSPMKGWEGIWIYFYPLAGSNYQGSFSNFHGLLSSNGRTMTTRSGVGLGDCVGFKLTKGEIPSDQPSLKVTGPPQNREPAAEEMRTGVKLEDREKEIRRMEMNNIQLKRDLDSIRRGEW